MIARNIDKIILLFLLLLYFFLNTKLLLVEPPVWPDEAYIADISYNILNEGRAATDLWGDTITGIRKALYWYPPIFTTSLSLWFKFFGLSIINQRFFSVVLGGFFIIVLYLLSQKFLSSASLFKQKLLGFSLILFFIFDNSFLKSSKIGRPEIMVVLLGFLGLYFYQRSKDSSKKKFYYLLTGFILGLTSLTHLVGLFFLILILGQAIFIKRDKMFYLLMVGFMPPLFIWFASIIPDYNIFLEQLTIQTSFRNAVPSYIESVFRLYPFEIKINYFLYLILSVICLLFIYKNNLFKYLLLLFGLGISWLICLQGKLEWYSIYIVSFLYLLTFVVINNASKMFSISIYSVLIILFLINVRIYFDSFNLYQNKNDSYFQFGQEVKGIIPEGKTVYISTTPDLYFILKGRNRLYEFPSLQTKEKEYVDLLNDSDFIVINFHLEHLFVGNILDKYIELNKIKEAEVGSGNIYQANIIELKPRNLRQFP